jgi:hypothetical protein
MFGGEPSVAHLRGRKSAMRKVCQTGSFLDTKVHRLCTGRALLTITRKSDQRPSLFAMALASAEYSHYQEGESTTGHRVLD